MSNYYDPLIGFETAGVLPVDEPLPQFSLVPEYLPEYEGRKLTHQDWFNTFLAHLAKYGAESSAAGNRMTMEQFTQEDLIRTNNARTTMSNIGAVIREVAGLPGGRGRPIFIYPLSLTTLGSQQVLRRYRQICGRDEAGLVRYTKQDIARVGRMVLEGGYQLLDPTTSVMIDPQTMVERR